MMLMLLGSIASNASSVQNDTISINQEEVSEWITEPAVTSTGKQTVHCYAIWNGYLLATTKTTMEKVALCKKYGAKCALIVVGRKSKDKFQPKRVVLN